VLGNIIGKQNSALWMSNHPLHSLISVKGSRSSDRSIHFLMGARETDTALPYWEGYTVRTCTIR
jgi:hypothetical protein